MAQIDLRNATIKIKDGYAGPGGSFSLATGVSGTFLVNNVAGYSGGATTMLVDGGTGILVNGIRFTVNGDAVEHTITAHSETLSNTTSITFTPGLGSAVVDNAALTILGYGVGGLILNLTGGAGIIATGDRFTVGAGTTIHTVASHTETLGITTQVVFTPALSANANTGLGITILPNEIEIKIGDGNLTYSEKRNIKYIKDRGRLSTVRQEDDEPVEVKMDAIWEFIKASSGQIPTIEDALKKRGEASDWVTSAADTCEPYAVDIEVLYTPPCSGEQKERITLVDFRWEQFEHDLRQGMFSVSGKCNATEASVARET